MDGLTGSKMTEADWVRCWRLTLARIDDPLIKGANQFAIVADCFTLTYPELHVKLLNEVDLALSACPEVESYESIESSLRRFLAYGLKLKRVVSMPRPCCFQLHYASYEAYSGIQIEVEHLVAVDGVYKRVYEKPLKARMYVRFPSKYPEKGALWVREKPGES
ncbi:MAG: hypothetical protein N3E44_05985 [Candidatus Bathyarchaeota archaeon]|nr:hypothetical protein [Candidatus Bathyarchaeota archaeon]